MAKDPSMVSELQMGRRTFLKGAAATLGLAAVAGAGCSPQEEIEPSGDEVVPVEEHIYAGNCRGNCFGGCKMNVRVRDGKVVSTHVGEFPNPAYNRICQKGLTHVQRIYDPNRLMHPLKRAGERGENKWEQITWEEAINEIATKWNQFREESGDSSIAFFGGSGNFGTAANQYPSRLSGLIHATSIQGCYDNGLFAGGGFSKGTGVNEIVDIVNANLIINWGANISEAQPQTWHFVLEAQKAGAKLITIDPVYTITASKSDQWITIRPATDTAMVMAMMNIAIENDWVDKDYIKIGTVGPFLVKESDGMFLRPSDLGEEVEGDPILVMDAEGNTGVPADIADPVIEGTYEVNGIKVTCAYSLLLDAIKEWTPARAAELCDVPEDVIYNLTKEYTSAPAATIYTGLGPDHYVNGHMFYFTVTGFAAICGQMGKPGATCGYDWPVGGAGVATAAVLTLEGSAAGPTIVAPKLLDAVREKNVEGLPIELRSIYCWNSNPIANQVERQAMIESFMAMDLVVVADMMITDTALYADIVLPVAHWFEVPEIMPMTTPYIYLQERCIDPLGECKSDVEIINLIAKGMGFTEGFDYTVDEVVQASVSHAGAEARGVTWEKFKEDKIARVYLDEPYYLGVGGVFPTPSGREQFYRETLYPYVNYGQVITDQRERLPYWEPPTEAWPVSVGGFEAHPNAAKYPLVYAGERNKMKCHTQFGRTPWLLELYEEPIIKMNPDDAAARGIVDGDYVRLFNDRGKVVVKAVLNPGIRPGMVIIPKGWEFDQFKEGHYSDLSSRVFNTTVPNNCYFDALIEIEKA